MGNSDRYAEFTRRVTQGEPLSEDLWLHHFEHQNAGARSGPDSGEPAPDFQLRDQNDLAHSRDALMGECGLLLVFARSADW